MHLASLNIPDLFINIWRGTFDCDGKDDKSTWDWAVLQGIVWEKHGKDVAACTPYLPGSFDHPPHNPAERFLFLMYFYGLGPALLFNILPERYWAHFCKLIYAMWIMNQHHISTEDLKKAHAALLEFAYEFELLIHALTHLGPEAVHIGPPIISSQWVMERTIGNLGEEIHQHSNPYANLSEWGLQQCQKPKIPRGAQDIGEGYVLLRARDKYLYKLDENELAAVRRANILPEVDDYLAVRRWGRLQLPNGQVAQSLWKESLKPLTKIRMARNVKACTSIILNIDFAEISFYFQLSIISNGERADETFALISTYSSTCTHGRVENMEIIPVKKILSVIAMIPYKLSENDPEPQYFLVEKPGLEVARMGGVEESIPDEF
ncbi:hypothetical protein BYT27DRAFT_7226131 [Phlegmacium glaucopus]|nr:hypothetical protein BYT27DRAFT_7226131 [Phlegmacium glaucopus]